MRPGIDLVLKVWISGSFFMQFVSTYPFVNTAHMNTYDVLVLLLFSFILLVYNTKVDLWNHRTAHRVYISTLVTFENACHACSAIDVRNEIFLLFCWSFSTMKNIFLFIQINLISLLLGIWLHQVNQMFRRNCPRKLIRKVNVANIQSLFYDQYI